MSIIFSGSTCYTGRNHYMDMVIRRDFLGDIDILGNYSHDMYEMIRGGCIDAPDILPARGFAVGLGNPINIWCTPRWQARGEPLCDDESLCQLF